MLDECERWAVPTLQMQARDQLRRVGTAHHPVRERAERAVMTRQGDPRGAENAWLQAETRRHFFGRCGVGLGTMALASLLERQGVAAPQSAARPGHFPAR